YTFDRCTNLEDFVIPKSVTRIGNSAFYNCNKLKNIIIPSNVTVIEKDAFELKNENPIFSETPNELVGWVFGWKSPNVKVYWAGEWHYDQDGTPIPN
ncbi:MAG TPA: leucine-rich repeat domain-containing protein, partial [Bacilli bacterium]|nr:leucine-rich repeat domain-containing protein [Bacilli bacterium]